MTGSAMVGMPTGTLHKAAIPRIDESDPSERPIPDAQIRAKAADIATHLNGKARFADGEVWLSLAETVYKFLREANHGEKV